MALTINPAVSGGHRPWLRHVATFFLGAVLGGAVALAACLLAVELLDYVLPVSWIALVAVALIVWAALHDLGAPLPLPYRDQQVPDWLRDVLPPGVVAAAFGAMLGVGFLTLFTYSTHLAVLLAVPFLGSVWAMMATITLFAVGKTAVLAGVIGVRSLDDVPVYWDPRRVRVLRAATAAASLSVGAALIASKIA